MSDLRELRRTLAVIPSDDLDRLHAVTQVAPDVVPGLLAWLEHATDWELSRRAERNFPLQPPSAALAEGEADRALIALGVLADAFGNGGSGKIAAFFHAARSALHADMPAPGAVH